MNGPGDIPTTNGTTTAERPCGFTSLIPTIGMSCRGRAEAFARRLQSKLRTLGSQSDDSPTGEEDPIIGLTSNPWIANDNTSTHVTNHQPLRSTSTEADSFFDFDCELESPGSPVDECEYSRLIETASTTPHDCAPESGYICASPITPASHEGSQSSSDEPFFDPELSDGDQRSLPTDYFDCEETKQEISQTTCYNGHLEDATKYLENDSSESLSDSLPPSQESTSANTPSLTQSSSTFTGVTSASNSTLQDIVLNELQQQSNSVNLQNGHHRDEERGNSEEKSDEKCETKVEVEVNSKPIEKQDKPLTNGFLHIPDSKDTENKLPSQESESQSPVQLEINNKSEVNNSNNRQKHLTSSDTDDEEDCRPQRVRRCSSLKTGKTPPGTPGRKKIVRFADVLGLDLADVKTFLDEIPTVPKSAYEDLEMADSEPPIQLGPRMDKILMPLFQQPSGLPTFLDIVREKQVCLENAALTDPINMTITGCVRVRNLDFHKSVYIRYTLDGWRSFADLQATYVKNSCDGFSDKFSFMIFGNSMVVGQRLEFAVRFHCKGQQYWDSNYGTNYCFQCLPATNPLSVRTVVPIVPSQIISPVDSWCGGSFY